MKKLIAGIDSLPPSRPVARELLTLRKEINGNIERLNALISVDPSLCAKVLKEALRTYKEFNKKEPILSSRDAIYKVLGYGPTMEIAMDVVRKHSEPLPLNGPIGLQYIWKHSVYLALSVYHVGELLRERDTHCLDRALLYTSGILHDIGYYVMAHLNSIKFAELNVYIDTANPPDKLLYEDELFGNDHAKIGAALLEDWEFPDEIVQAVRHHHDVDYDGPHRAYILILNVLEHYLPLCFGKQVNAGIESLIQQRTEELGLSYADIESCIDKVLEDSHSIDFLLNEVKFD